MARKLRDFFSRKAGALQANQDDSGADAWFQRGTAQLSLEQWQPALDAFREAVRIDPNHALAYAWIGNVLSHLGDHEGALRAYDRAIELKPGIARVVSNRAQAQAKLGLLAEARRSHDEAVSLDPSDAAIQFNRGAFLSDVGDSDGAIASYRAAIAVQPNYAEAYCNLGLVQQEAGLSDAAMESYSQAIGINPRLATAYNNRGNLFRSKKLFADAILDFRQAIALEPDSADIHFNIGQMALLQGDLTAGWQEYEWRPRIKEALQFPARQLPQPSWFGEPTVQGQRIFLYPEQGLGDTIQFCRYVPLVAALGAQVLLEVQPSLGGLLRDLDGVSQLIQSGDPIPPADYQCSLMSLPGAFKTTLDTIPRQVPYLRADPDKVARWHEILGPRTRPRIGLSWSGNPLQSNDHNRSMPLARWLPYLTDEFEYVCLHNVIRDSDRQTLRAGTGITTVDSHLRDFADTAALIEALDLVISVDTSLAHLSGAMGKQTWVLLCFLPDWRWLLDRRDNPWYPTATLYRQPVAGDWSSVLAEVSNDLRKSFGYSA
jgi:tetratricopeptide (TPR) repeat protein